MYNLFWKNLYLCFSKLRCLPTIQPPPTSVPSPPPPPQNRPLSNHFTPPLPILSATTGTNTINNFNNFLYDTTSLTLSSSADDCFFSSSSSSFFTVDDNFDLINAQTFPDLTTLFTSTRFFFSSPGRSKSIFESVDPKPINAESAIQVSKYSENPYADFRRSMQEMIEARGVKVDAKNDWEYLHELLLCYLRINPKNTHKFVISAFVDLIVCLLAPVDNCREPSENRQQWNESRLFIK